MTTSYARIVHDVPAGQRVAAPPPPPTGRLEDYLVLCAALREAGYDVGDTVAKIEAILAAVDQAIAPDDDRYLAGVLDTDPADVAERVRQAGLNRAAWSEMTAARSTLTMRLALDAGASLRAGSDQIIAAMRRTFDPAIKTVEAAASAGLTPSTNAAALADTADTTTLTAYRALGPAVATLDGIARLRTQMAQVAGIGPAEPVVANFLAVNDNAALEGAEHLWRGDTELVQHDLPEGFGSYLARVVRPRLGGPWLALAVAGYKLRLRTATEAHAVVAKARAADEAKATE